MGVCGRHRRAFTSTRATFAMTWRRIRFVQTGRFLATFFLLGGVAVSLSLVSPAARASASTGLMITDLNNGATPSDLANNLVGSGVTVSNVTYTGDNRAAGTFTGGSGIIGFASGIVLDTGKVQTYSTDPPCSVGVEGPNSCYEAVGSNPPGPDGSDNFNSFWHPRRRSIDNPVGVSNIRRSRSQLRLRAKLFDGAVHVCVFLGRVQRLRKHRIQ